MALLSRLKYASGIVIFVTILLLSGPESLAEALLAFRFPYLALALIPLAIFTLLGAASLAVLLKPEGVGFSRLLRAYLGSWGVGYLLPGKIGEFSLAYFLRYRVPIGRTTAILLIDKAVTFAVLFAVALVGVPLLLNPSESAITIGLSLGAFSAGAALFLTRQGRRLIRRCLTSRYEGMFAGFSATLLQYRRRRKGLLAWNVLITLLRWPFQVLITFLLLLGVGVAVDGLVLFAIIAVTAIASFIPLTANGTGIKEGLFVLLAGRAGLPFTPTVAMVAVSFLINYAMAACFLSAFAFRERQRPATPAS